MRRFGANTALLSHLASVPVFPSAVEANEVGSDSIMEEELLHARVTQVRNDGGMDVSLGFPSVCVWREHGCR
jgi:hypothetical protein